MLPRAAVNRHSVALSGHGLLDPSGWLNNLSLTALLVIACAVGDRCVAGSPFPSEDPSIAPRMLQPPRDASEYYPPAALRLGETGRVVLQFTVDADGKAIEPFAVDEGQSMSPSERLVVAARSYLKDAKFASRTAYTKSLTASFVFELAPCGTLRHSSMYDYAVEVCRDRPSPPEVLNPGVALTDK